MGIEASVTLWFHHIMMVDKTEVICKLIWSSCRAVEIVCCIVDENE